MVSQEIVSRIQKRSPSYFNDFNSHRGVQITLKKSIIQSHTDFFLFKLKQGNAVKKVWLKQIRRHPLKRLVHDTKKDFYDLKKIEKIYEDLPSFNISKPLDIFTDDYSYLMEDCKGRNLSYFFRFRNPLLRPTVKNLKESVKLCAQWLRILNESPLVFKQKDNSYEKVRRSGSSSSWLTIFLD